MFIAELRLAHPDLVLAHTIGTVPGMEIELEYQTITDAETYHLFFRVAGESFDDFEAAVAEDPTVSDSTPILDGGTFRVYRMRLEATDHLVLPKAAEFGMRVLQARAGDGGWIGRLQVPETAALREFRAYCERKGIEFTVKRIYQSGVEGDASAFGLTPAQRETLLTAHRVGYFNEPRDASLQDVADRLGISSSSASGRLRRAIAALVENTLLEDVD